MQRLTVHLVIGARPNLPKVAALRRACLGVPGVVPVLVDTGQHTNPALNEELARDLGLPSPDLRIESGERAGTRRIARIMRGYDALLERKAPDAVIVVGDVDSTLACALTAARRRIPAYGPDVGVHVRLAVIPDAVDVRIRLARIVYVGAIVRGIGNPVPVRIAGRPGLVRSHVRRVGARLAVEVRGVADHRHAAVEAWRGGLDVQVRSAHEVRILR